MLRGARAGARVGDGALEDVELGGAASLEGDAGPTRSWSSHAEMRCGGSVGGSTRSASHWSYDHGHSPVFDFWKTARPRLPKVHSAGQYPPPCGSFARNSTMPPVKQNLFHDCSIAERNGMWMPFSRWASRRCARHSRSAGGAPSCRSRSGPSARSPGPAGRRRCPYSTCRPPRGSSTWRPCRWAKSLPLALNSSEKTSSCSTPSDDWMLCAPPSACRRRTSRTCWPRRMRRRGATCGRSPTACSPCRRQILHEPGKRRAA